MKRSLLFLADIARGLFLGALVSFAIYVIVLRDAGTIIVRYAGY